LFVPISSLSSRKRRFTAGDLAVVDAALRHLPAFDGLVDALADEHQPFPVEQHDADAGPIGKVFVAQGSSRHIDGEIAIYFDGAELWPKREREQTPCPLKAVSPNSATRSIVTG
jgi:hypothetical protein